jgi:hypothetical protein
MLPLPHIDASLKEMERGFDQSGCVGLNMNISLTGSDYPVLQDYEAYKETFAYIERLGLPKSDTDKILHHNAQKLFGFDH